jgi:hypothetical protein
MGSRRQIEWAHSRPRQALVFLLHFTKVLSPPTCLPALQISADLFLKNRNLRELSDTAISEKYYSTH